MRHRSLALALLLIIALAACGDDDTTATTASNTGGSSSGGDPATLTISGFSFGDPITVAAGTEVTATNQDGATHTWTSDDGLWDSGNLSGGDSFSFTFTDPGTYSFHCNIHGSMTGTVTVTG